MKTSIRASISTALSAFLILCCAQQLLGTIQSLGSLNGLSTSSGNPLLVVLLMVRDEKDVIIPTLESYLTKKLKTGEVDDGEVAYLIYDTGSIDGTDTMAREFYEKNKVKNFLVTSGPWVDFATSRNAGLAIAREKYPQSTFILFVDAEWFMHNMDGLVEFCREEATKKIAGAELPCYYRIMLERPGTRFGQQRLFLTHDDVQFEGVVHEVPNKYANGSVPKNVYINLGCSKCGYEKSRKRWFRDRDLLLKDLLANPKNPRTAYYLALTELWLGNYRNAYTYFKIRTELYSFPEEDYAAQYYLGLVTEILITEEPGSFTWDDAFKQYLKAYAMRPHRAEPLVKIGRHYLNESNHALAYLFAKRAAELPFPDQDVLPIEKSYYEFDRFEILSRCSWYIGEYDVGEEAAKKVIESRPNVPQYYKNLSHYWERKK